MGKRLGFLMVLALVLVGCGVKVVPRPTATALLNVADNSLTEEKAGVSLSARVEDLEVATYRLNNNLTSFHVTVANGTEDELNLSSASFVLVDEQGFQYRAVPPGQVQDLISRDSLYLIPYPYVGYYYLEDRERYAFFNTFNSALPYFAENYPQDLLTRALPEQAILPGAKIAGLVYFLVDLPTKKDVQLRVFMPGTPPASGADFILPFSIEKK